MLARLDEEAVFALVKGSFLFALRRSGKGLLRKAALLSQVFPCTDAPLLLLGRGRTVPVQGLRGVVERPEVALEGRRGHVVQYGGKLEGGVLLSVPFNGVLLPQIVDKKTAEGGEGITCVGVIFWRKEIRHGLAGGIVPE